MIETYRRSSLFIEVLIMKRNNTSVPSLETRLIVDSAAPPLVFLLLIIFLA